MKNNDEKNILIDLVNVVDIDRKMPEYIFTKKFKHHFFFDADITTSDEIICAIKQTVLLGVGDIRRLAVFSSVTREIIGLIDQGEDWATRMTGMTASMHQSGNYYGYIAVDSSLRWAAYQADPVSLGVLAFDGRNPWEDVSQDVRECFMNRKRIEDLFISDSIDCIELINIFGRDYFFNLIKNYP